MDETLYRKGLKYVDVRGIDPVLVHGQVAVSLPSKPRSIALSDAMPVAESILRNKVTLR